MNKIQVSHYGTKVNVEWAVDPVDRDFKPTELREETTRAITNLVQLGHKSGSEYMKQWIGVSQAYSTIRINWRRIN